MSSRRFRRCRSNGHSNCKSETKRCRRTRAPQRVAWRVNPPREEGALLEMRRWRGRWNRRPAARPRPRAPFPGMRRQGKPRSLGCGDRSASARNQCRSCFGTAAWAARNSRARREGDAPASLTSSRPARRRDRPSSARARRDTPAEAACAAGMARRTHSSRRPHLGRRGTRGSPA